MEYRGDTGDPYVDPQTGVLRNLAGISDQLILDGYEGEMSVLRQVELADRPPASFDFAHLKEIHRCLFQDVYAWAGEPRTVDITKGSSRFGSHFHIESYLTRVFSQLTRERNEWEKSPSAVNWAERFAYYLGEINAAHPFREGNGRVQRIFISHLAARYGFEIRWDLMTEQGMIEASIASFDGDNQLLEKLIQKHLHRIT
jgi:cell filamentation protein